MTQALIQEPKFFIRGGNHASTRRRRLSNSSVEASVSGGLLVRFASNRSPQAVPDVSVVPMQFAESSPQLRDPVNGSGETTAIVEQTSSHMRRHLQALLSGVAVTEVTTPNGGVELMIEHPSGRFGSIECYSNGRIGIVRSDRRAATGGLIIHVFAGTNDPELDGAVEGLGAHLTGEPLRSFTDGTAERFGQGGTDSD